MQEHDWLLGVGEGETGLGCESWEWVKEKISCGIPSDEEEVARMERILAAVSELVVLDDGWNE